MVIHTDGRHTADAGRQTPRGGDVVVTAITRLGVEVNSEVASGRDSGFAVAVNLDRVGWKLVSPAQCTEP